MTPSNASALLHVRGLRVGFGDFEAVKGVDLDVHSGQVMGLVGESGSGKSVIARSVMNLLREPGKVTAGSIRFAGTELLQLDESGWRDIRGRDIAMIFQDPLSALNPSMRVGDQVAETLRAHGASDTTAKARALELLTQVGIPAARTRYTQYPHEFSGGMRQRVVIAAALANNPRLLIADEPTTALDVTVQAQILDLMRALGRDLNVATLFITHDLGVVAELCDDVTVLYRGEVVERAGASELFAAPREAYTKALLASVPRIDDPIAVREISPAQAVLRVEKLRVDVTNGKRDLLGRRSPVYAVDTVDLEIRPGETLGLVGESGCGKSTLSRAITGIASIASGSVELGGVDVTALSAGTPQRRMAQLVFQDAYAALNPLRTVRQSLEEARQSAQGDAKPADVESLMAQVGLDLALLDRRPGAASGGQRQRVGIARALAAQPQVLLCDEPVSALDVTIQAQVMQLLADLRDELGVGILFVSHDLAVVREISDRVAVMFLGRIVETGTADEIYSSPQHPYTVALLSASPVPEVGGRRDRIVLGGDPPSPGAIPAGCRFASRCPIGPLHDPTKTVCLSVDPQLAGDSHQTACHFPGQLSSPVGVIDHG